MTQTLYEVITTPLGADRPTHLLFGRKKDAIKFLSVCKNGEIESFKVEADMPWDGIETGSDGCTWDDLKYALGVWCGDEWSISARKGE